MAEVRPNGQPQLVAFDRDGQRGTAWLRIPPKARKDQPTNVVLWLHGARGNGFDHQQALAGIGLGKAEILLCPNGSKRGGPAAYDHAGGAAPILAALDELASGWKLGPVVLGGHSQGAFTAHAVLAAAPERFAGVVAFSGGAGRGAAPAEMLAKLGRGRHAPPICLVHGERDDTVDVGLDDRLYEQLLDAGWPALRYLHPPGLDHALAEQHLKEAFEWVLPLASDKPQELLAAARSAAAGERPGDALFALARAEALNAPAGQVPVLRRQALARAAALAKEWDARLGGEKTRAEALARFYDARSGLSGVDGAQPPFKTLARLRAEQDAPAQEALREAKGLGSSHLAEARTRMAALIERFPAAYEAVREANAWLKKNAAR